MPLRSRSGHARRTDRTRSTRRTFTLTLTLTLTLAAVAALLALPAAAAALSPWPMPNADVGATNQSPVAGPTDPGLKWHLDLGDVQTADAPEGYGSLNDILVSDAGVLIAMVSNEDGQYEPTARFRNELIGIDATTAEVLWEVPNVSPVSSGSCAPALDSQDRVWVEQRPDAGDRVVRAFDPATGEHLGPEIAAEEQRCREQIIIGGEGDDERMVFSTSSAEDLRMFDISGDDPVEIDVALADRTDVDDLLNHGNRDHWAVMTGDHLVTLIEIVDDEGDEVEHRIVSIDLTDGTTTDELTLPTVDGVDSTEVDRAYLLAHDDRVYLSTRKTGDSQILAIDAAGGDLSLDWEFDLDLRAPDLTLGDGVVLFQDGRRAAGAAPSVTALDLETGSLVFDNGEPVGDHPLANPDGSFYGRTTDGGTRLDEISLMDAGGEVQWRIDRGRLTQEVPDADEYDDLRLGVSFDLAAIGEDGTLYVTTDRAILALDDTGGLVEFICGDTFVDVEEENTHACNIDEMAARDITQGVGDDRYDPSGDVTRQQFASFLVNALDEVEPAATGPFTDVNPDSVHAPNIFGAAAAGITQGTSDTTFAPADDINRAQVASLLARAFDLDPVDQGPFTDVDTGNVHAGNINAAFAAGITQGVSDTEFNPDATLRRDQMASLLIRALDAAEDQ